MAPVSVFGGRNIAVGHQAKTACTPSIILSPQISMPNGKERLMNTLFRQIWIDEHGMIVSAEMITIVTIMVIGLIVGVVIGRFTS